MCQSHLTNTYSIVSGRYHTVPASQQQDNYYTTTMIHSHHSIQSVAALVYLITIYHYSNNRIPTPIVQRPACINANKHLRDNLVSFNVIKIKLMKVDFRNSHFSTVDNGQRPALQSSLRSTPHIHHRCAACMVILFH